MASPWKNLVVAFFALACLRWLPSAWHGRAAGRLWADEPAYHHAMAQGIDHWREQPLSADDLLTGSQRFDGEWLFGTHMMSAMGYGQLAAAHPQHRERYLRAMEDSIDHLLAPEVRAFDRRAWGSDPLDDLGTDRGHAAYLGYLALAVSMHRHLDPHSRFATLHDQICQHLQARLQASPIGLVQTYPGETYPVDNTAIFGALALHERTTGTDHSAVLHAAGDTLARNTDPDTGLLIQKVESRTGATVDGPRGSGTALATYFTSFWDHERSASLYFAMRGHLHRSVLGFGAVREYPPGVDGRGDIDSGPVVFGVSVSASGFALAGARIHDDREWFERFVATAHLFGAPVEYRGARQHALGGPLGDALMFALLTAQPSATWQSR